MRAAAIIAVGLALLAANVVGWGAVVAAVERSEARTHAEHHTGQSARPCGCAPGVEELRAEVAASADMVAQRLDMVESRCVWLGPHRVPVMRTGRPD
jgi:hypothetical protein